MSWGTELWDKYEDLCSHTNSGIDFLEKSVAEFIKERGRVEKLHAKNLRDLVKRFMPKGIGNPTNPKQTGTQGLTNNGVKCVTCGPHGPEHHVVLINAVRTLKDEGSCSPL